MTKNTSVIWDMGACTVHSLIYGYDNDLEETNNNQSQSDQNNPCVMIPNYYAYRQAKLAATSNHNSNMTRTWDYVVMNDHTQSPSRNESRQESLQALQDSFLPMFLDHPGATPIFLFTYAYDSPYRDMSGVVDIPTFTSLTNEGYKEYAQILQKALPDQQPPPRIAPVGLAFLMVWEGNYALWKKLFHIDYIHPSLHGTYLQGCVIYATIYGRMPHPTIALENTNIVALWNRARRFQPVEHRHMPIPTIEEAKYLYYVAQRITLYQHQPKSLKNLPHQRSNQPQTK